MAEVAEAEGDPAQVLEPSVDGFDGAVGGAHIEVGEDLAVSLPQGSAELRELRQFGGYTGPDRLEELVHRDLAVPPPQLIVGVDQALVDDVSDLYSRVGVVRDERLPEPDLLLVGQQLLPGQERPANPVQRIAGPAPVSGGGLLDALAAHGELVCGQVHDVEGDHHRTNRRHGLGGGGVVAGEPVYGDDLDAVAERPVTSVEPVGHGFRRAALNHVQHAGRAGAIDHRGEVDQHGHERAAAIAADMLPLVLVHPEHAYALEVAGLVVDQGSDPRNRQVIDQIPAQAEGLGHRGHAGAVDRQALQDPAGAPAGGLSPRLGQKRHALLEDPRAAVGIAADESRYAHMQSGGMPDDGEISDLALDVVPQAPPDPALAALQVKRDRGAEQVRELPGDRDVGDGHPEFDGAADGVGKQAGGSVQSGSWGVRCAV